MTGIPAAALGRVTGVWNNLREAWAETAIDNADAEAEEQA